MIHFQIFLQCIAEEEEPPRWGIERTGRMKALYGWERNSLEGFHEVEAMERSALKRRKNFVEGVNMWAKGESSVKGYAKELDSGVKWKKVASQPRKRTFALLSDKKDRFQRTSKVEDLGLEFCRRELSARSRQQFSSQWWPKLYGLEAFNFGSRPR